MYYDIVYLAQTLSGVGAENAFKEGEVIVTWAEIRDARNPGQTEGFYCSVPYKANQAEEQTIDVVTLIGYPNLAHIRGNVE